MKNQMVSVCFLVLAACGDSVIQPTQTQPEATKSQPTVITISEPSPVPVKPVPTTSMVSVASQSTGQTNSIAVTSAAEPPSCAWRDDVIRVHIELGGKKNDIVTLANLHRVYIVDTGSAPGYKLEDYPIAWCVR